MAERSPKATRPLVSVVMPCYNAASFVKEAVDCALGQTYREVQLVVVDDGSDDGSVDVLRQLQADNPARMRLLNQHRKGPYPARNLGLRHATGDLIAFLDADDRWRPDFLEQMHAALTAHKADLAYCGWQNFGEGAPGVEPYVPPAYEEADPVAAFLRTCPWPIHAVLLRRPIIDALGGFSEERFSSMDYDLWLRILGQTRRMVRVPEVMAFYRWHTQGQVSSVKWRQVLDALEAQRGFIRDHPGLVAHLPHERLQDLTEGQVLRQAYRAIWKRDLASSQHLFRHVARARSFKWRDLPQVASACLPTALYAWLIALRDSSKTDVTETPQR